MFLPDPTFGFNTEIASAGYGGNGELAGETGIAQLRLETAADHIARCGAQLHNNDLQCILVSKGVSASEAAQLGLEYASTPQEAVDAAFQKHGLQARVYVYPGSAFAGLIVK